jgi:hypothetical protein
MITLFSIKQTGQYLGTLDGGFLRSLRPAGKQHDDLPAALREIDAPPRAQMYPQFRNAFAYGQNISHQSSFQPFDPGYSIFTSGVYRATVLDAALPQEKTHFATLACAE